MRRTAIGAAALLLATGLAQGAEPAPVHLTLEGAIETALQYSTTVLKARNSDEDAGARLLQGYAQFLPTVDSSLSYTHNSGTTLYTISGTTLVTAHDNAMNFTIGSTLNLFNGLADWGALKSSLQRRSAAELSLQFARQQIDLDTTQTYLQVVLDQQLMAITQRNLEASDARLKLLRGQSAVGQISPADLQRQEAQRAADDQSLTQSTVRSHDDLLLLIRKLRLDPAREYVLDPPSLQVSAAPLAARPDADLIRQALDRRLDLRAQQSLSSAADWDVTVARGPYFPKLNLGFLRAAAGTYLLDQSLNGVDVTPAAQSGLGAQLGTQVNYAVALTLSWNLFNRLVDRTNVVHARIAADNARIDADDLRLKVTADIRQAKADFDAAARQLVSARSGTQAAQAAFRTVEGRYRVGASSFIDVLAAQSALVTAQASEAQAAINLKLQEKTVLFAAGEL